MGGKLKRCIVISHYSLTIPSWCWNIRTHEVYFNVIWGFWIIALIPATALISSVRWLLHSLKNTLEIYFWVFKCASVQIPADVVSPAGTGLTAPLPSSGGRGWAAAGGRGQTRPKPPQSRRRGNLRGSAASARQQLSSVPQFSWWDSFPMVWTQR